MKKTDKPSPRSFRAPLYAMAHSADGGVHQLGGPFDDIDDVLDACWDHILGSDLSTDAVFFMESSRTGLVRRVFPRGAFPEIEETACQA